MRRVSGLVVLAMVVAAVAVAVPDVVHRGAAASTGVAPEVCAGSVVSGGLTSPSSARDYRLWVPAGATVSVTGSGDVVGKDTTGGWQTILEIDSPNGSRLYDMLGHYYDGPYFGQAFGDTDLGTNNGAAGAFWTFTVSQDYGTLVNYRFTFEVSVQDGHVCVPPGLLAAAKKGGTNPSMPCLPCMLSQVASFGWPVDASTGNFWHTFSDLHVPGRGVDLAFSHTYNSADAAVDGPLGHGWSSPWAQHLEIGSATVVFVQENGSEASFSLDGSAWVADDFVVGALTHEADGTWTLVRDHTSTFRFDAGGALTSVSDRHGDATTVAHPSATLTTVTDPAGRQLQLHRSGGRLTSVVDPIGRTVSFDVDPLTGDLDSFTDVSGGTWAFTYDGAHRLLTMQDPGGGVTKNQYDTSGRVTRQWSPTEMARPAAQRRALTFDYGVAGRTTVTDEELRSTVQRYANGFLVAETRGAGTPEAGTWTYEYDPVTGGPSKVTDPNGHEQLTGWWSRCDTPAGGCAPGRVAWTRDGTGAVTSYRYNTAGLVTQVLDASGIATTWTYSGTPAVDVASVARPLLAPDGTVAATRTTTYVHGDPAHPEDVTTVVDPRGKSWDYEYDAAGNVTRLTDPLGHGAPSGHETTWGHDPVGRQVWSVTARGSATGADPDLYRSAVVHDDAGRVTVTAGAAGAPATDGFNRPDAPSVGAAETGAAWTVLGAGTFGVDDRRLALTSAPNATNLAVLPSAADVVVGATMAVAQGGQSLVFRVQNANNYWRFRASSSTGRWDLVKVVASVPTTVASSAVGTCCTSGQQVRVAADGSSVRAFVDGVEVVAATDATLATATRAGVQMAATGAGRIDDVYVAGVAGGVTTAAYDANGRAAWVLDGRGARTAFTRRADGGLIGVSRPDGTSTAYVLDRTGLTTSYTDAGSATTVWSHDAQGRVVAHQAPGEAATTIAHTYDPAGERTTVTRPGGGTVTTTFDAVGRVAAVDHSDTTPDVAITYDELGRHTAMTTGTATSTWAWDSLGRLTSSTRAGRTMAYGYDLAGNVTQRTYPGDKVVATAYDDAGRPTTVSPWAGGDITFTWDDDGNPLTTTFPNGVVTTRTWSPGGRLSGVAHTRSGATLAAFAHTFDPASQLTGTTVTGTAGLPSPVAHAYDPNGRVTSGPEGTYGYDAADHATRLGTGVHQAFTDSGELCWTGATAGTCGSPPTGATTYAYDARGNRVGRTSGATTSSYGYDLADRLVSFTAGATSATYEYDGDGVRLAKTVDGTTTAFTWDEAGGMPLLVAARTERFVHGPLGEPLLRVDGTGRTYVHQDHLGSTRLLTDAAGAVVGTYTYGTYGQTDTTGSPGHTGTASIGLLYTGEYRDAESGLYHLRARAYDPATAQFTSRDPAEATTAEPYGYVGGNPVNYRDPLGLWRIPGTNFCIDIGDPNCRSIAEQHPAVAEGITNVAGGALEANPFFMIADMVDGLAGREIELADHGVDRCSGSYTAGFAAMTAVDLLLGLDRLPFGPRRPGGPKPPGWTPDWQAGPASRTATDGWHWWDPQGGEWRYHVDRHHSPHWDHNPWTDWNTKWEHRGGV